MFAFSDEQVGQPLLLNCDATIVRSITSTSSVDIVWFTNGKEVKRVNNVLGHTADNSV